MSGVDSAKIYDINRRFITQAFDMFCTMLADKDTTLTKSFKPEGKFKITNKEAGFDHEGFAFFRDSSFEGKSLPFLFVFGERGQVDEALNQQVIIRANIRQLESRLI